MGFFPPTPPAGSPQPKSSAWDMSVFTLTQFCTQTTSVLPTSDHSSPGLRIRKTARSRSWNHTGFWSVAKPVSEVRFIDRVTTCKQHMLPLLQTFCRKDALCTDNHRYAGWNPALRNARHLAKWSVLHWPLPGGTQKVVFVTGLSLGWVANVLDSLLLVGLCVETRHELNVVNVECKFKAAVW